MRRYWFAVLGSAFLVVQLGLLYAIGIPSTFDWSIASLVGYALAGAAFLVAGVHEWLPIPDGVVPWYWFAGAGDILLGLGMLSTGVTSALEGDSGSLFFGVLISAGSLVLVFTGIDYARGGVHLDLSTFE
ncbi:hypothetical protein [Halostella litorea]|uniref:hypothetical protein n=1 Tax=Halostella litorea TaxID=2528831 RepID=UPI001091BC4C|nr:hypothetical protein [Halostella litorea]